jgi:pyruvate formate lyase activating enzyme
MITEYGIEAKSNSEIISELGGRFKQYRLFSNLTQKQCGGHLQPVLDTLLTMKKAGVHLEITNLLIPGVNDGEGMIRDMCSWLRDNGFADCPLHFSRFFPQYKMQDSVPTPTETLFTATSF